MLPRHLVLTVCFIPVFGGRGRSGGYGGGQRASYPSGAGLSKTSRGYPSGGATYQRSYPGTNRAGFSLKDLGRMSACDKSTENYGSEYRSNLGEMCKLAISHQNVENEETRVDCRLMSSFIRDAERESKTVSTHTVVSQTVINNGTTTQNTTVVDALQVKEPSLQVTPGMDCFMIKISRDTSQLRRHVDCALLHEYAIRLCNGCDKFKTLMELVLLCCVWFLFSY